MMRASLLLITGNLALSLLGILFLTEYRNPRRVKNVEIPSYFLLGMLFLIVSAIHMLEVKIDPIVTSKYSLDFTRFIYNLEGNIVGTFQSWTNPFLDYYLVFVYMIGFPFLVYFTPAFFILSKDLKGLKMAVVAYAIIVSVALPFYLFFPVNDAWWASQNYPWYTGKAIIFRLPQIWPGITNQFFRFTTINNCFPSLHSCLSMAMAGIIWLRGYKRFAIVATFIAISIPIATLYLGIHWFTDVIAGEFLALAAILISYKITTKITTGE